MEIYPSLLNLHLNTVALLLLYNCIHILIVSFNLKGSWSESIKNRFKHVRKYDSKKRALATEQLPTGTKSFSTPVRPVKVSRKMDFWNVVPTCEDTSQQIEDDHVAELHREMQRPPKNQDVAKIAELMRATYKMRRKAILTSAIPVRQLLIKYPPLATVNGVIIFLKSHII